MMVTPPYTHAPILYWSGGGEGCGCVTGEEDGEEQPQFVGRSIGHEGVAVVVGDRNGTESGHKDNPRESLMCCVRGKGVEKDADGEAKRKFAWRLAH